jgi:hypothetical protein
MKKNECAGAPIFARGSSTQGSSAIRSTSPLSKVKTFSELPSGDDGWVFHCEKVNQWFRFVRDPETKIIKVHQAMTKESVRKMTDANKPMLVDGAEYFTDSTNKMKYVASLTDDSEIQRKEFYIKPTSKPVVTQRLILIDGDENALGLKYELIYNEDKPNHTADCVFIQP